MVKRKITLQDGRYLIFYTFDEQAGNRLDSRPQASRLDAKEPGAQADETGRQPERRRTDP